MELVRDRQPPLRPADDDVLCRIAVLADDEHLHGRDQQKDPEEIENPVVAGDELRADRDHDAAHDERAQDAPEQHPVLVDARDRHEREDHRDDEDVVHAQRLLHDVAGQILHGGGGAIVDLPVDGIHGEAESHPLVLVAHIHEHAERESEGDPHGRPPEGLAHRDHVSVPVKHPEVQRQHHQHEQKEAGPYPHHQRVPICISVTALLTIPVQDRHRGRVRTAARRSGDTTCRSS